MSDALIQDGSIITVHFTLTLSDGEVADTSRGQEPMEYLHGAGNIVPGLERELDGKSVGDSLQVEVQPADGFGVRREEVVQPVPREQFPADVEFDIGMQFGFEDEQGDVAPGWVVAFDDKTVTIDLNHPLAGQVLKFDIEILAIRAATDEEMTHGHPHGAGGCDHDH